MPKKKAGSIVGQLGSAIGNLFGSSPKQSGGKPAPRRNRRKK